MIEYNLESLFTKFLHEIILEISGIEKSVNPNRDKNYFEIRDKLKPYILEDNLRVSFYYKLKQYRTQIGFEKWENISIQKYFDEIETKEKCDLYFEDNCINQILRMNSKCYEYLKKKVWIEFKFLLPDIDRDTSNNTAKVINDFLRLYYYTGKYKPENKNKIDTYFIMLILCGEDIQSSPKDPRYDFGIKRDRISKTEMDKIIYPNNINPIEFNFKAFLNNQRDSVENELILEKIQSEGMPELESFWLSRTMITPLFFDENTEYEKLKLSLVGYIYKLFIDPPTLIEEQFDNDDLITY
jgi:hypothetical protein